MVIIGLTGSIGMGKSTTSAMFRRLGVPVQDADAVVHRLLARGGAAVEPVGAAFPGVVREGAVDRKALGARVFGDAEALRRLESILHPLVERDRARFLRRAASRRCPAVVLDVPLLFETGGERRCDLTVLVTAPPFVQAARVLARPGMTRERLAQIRAKQTPDRCKAMRADAVIGSGRGRRPVWAAVRRIVNAAKERDGRHWPPRAGGWLPHAKPVRCWPGPVNRSD